MVRELTPAVNGTEQRLDLLIAEVRGLRADLASARSPRTPDDTESVTTPEEAERPTRTRRTKAID